MRKLLFLALLFLAGCTNLRGPLQSQQPVRVDDPLLPTYEQEKLGRAYVALPDDPYQVGDKSGVVTQQGIYGRGVAPRPAPGSNSEVLS
jgi:hypothetical protein